MQKNERGFTLLKLIEIFLVLAVIAVVFWGGIFLTICAGNYWYTEDGALRELQINHPNVTEIVKTTRNVIPDSVITVRESGELHNYCLDSNILFNYKFSECK